MKKWNCKVCDYTHQGEQAPEHCPVCGSPADRFYLENRTNRDAFSVFLIVIIVAAILFAVFGCGSSVTVDNSSVQSLELNRYLGRWYEVARFDHRFERHLTHCTATYTLEDDGTLRIENQGMKKGRLKTSIGKGKLTEQPGVFRVSFFGPFYSDYRVLMIAPDYSYALVGGSSDHYLWILSRTPELSSSIRDTLLQEAHRRGYTTSNLQWVPQF